MSHKRRFWNRWNKVDTETSQAISGSNLTTVDKLAVRCAIASLEMLKQAASELGVSIDALTPELMTGWIGEL